MVNPNCVSQLPAFLVDQLLVAVLHSRLLHEKYVQEAALSDQYRP